MNKGRVEALTDGIVAIEVTIMVLEIKIPRGPGLASLLKDWPYFAAYLLSFLIIASNWYMHSYFFSRARWISKRAFWANNLWLVMMSLFPVTTGWVSEYPGYRIPEYLYFATSAGVAGAYYLLNYVIVHDNRASQPKMTSALSRIRHEPVDILLLLVGAVTIYFYPRSGMFFVVLQGITWAVFTPIRSDRPVGDDGRPEDGVR